MSSSASSLKTSPDSVNTLSDNSFDKANKFLADINTKINNKFSEILANKSPCPTLQQALEYTILSSGKKLRPALVYAVVEDIKYLSSPQDDTKNTQQLLLNSACALELIHTYSIVHDDLPAMDDDDLRRGQPSCHKKFNEATAILIGDTMQSLAFELLADCQNLDKKSPAELIKQIKISSIISQAIGHQGMVAGQSLELNQSAKSEHLLNQESIDLLNTIHNLKTGKLFTACLQVGAVIANANSEAYSLITKLGESLGLAFQIQDDILDFYQSSEQLGKPSNSDAERNLPTYSNIMGLEQAEAVLEQKWQECADILKNLPINLEQSILSLLVNKIKARVY